MYLWDSSELKNSTFEQFLYVFAYFKVNFKQFELIHRFHDKIKAAVWLIKNSNIEMVMMDLFN